MTCGTSAGHTRHVRAGEDSCQPCRDAHRAKMAAHRQGRVAAMKLHPSPRLAVEFPRLHAETFADAPCALVGPGGPWEGQRPHEPAQKARQRWQEAARLCLTSCPAFTACKALHDAQERPDGVWAGLVPRANGEHR